VFDIIVARCNLEKLACQFRPAANMQTSFTQELDRNMGTDIYCG
jgi:hypothetical protein